MEQTPKPSIGSSPIVETKARDKPVQHKPNNIVFLRRRALYARPALNAQGQVRFGLKHDRMYSKAVAPSGLTRTRCIESSFVHRIITTDRKPDPVYFPQTVWST